MGRTKIQAIADRGAWWTKAMKKIKPRIESNREWDSEEWSNTVQEVANETKATVDARRKDG